MRSNSKSAYKYELNALHLERDIYILIVDSITAKHVYQAYLTNPEQEPQKSIRDTQVQAIADSFGKIVSAYHPVEIIGVMGSQTKDKEALFDPAIKLYYNSGGSHQANVVPKSRIVITELSDIGILGAVGYWLSKHE